jgi:hypothetical protein
VLPVPLAFVMVLRVQSLLLKTPSKKETTACAEEAAAARDARETVRAMRFMGGSLGWDGSDLVECLGDVRRLGFQCAPQFGARHAGHDDLRAEGEILQ